MEADRLNINILSEAKNEYTRQLINMLFSHLYDGIRTIYEASRNYCEKNGDKNVLKKFQSMLATVPKWNTDRITDEYKRIVRVSECDWIEDLITAVFVSHTKILASVKMRKKQKKSIQLDVPNGPYFIHKCYIECARNFWKKPYLFSHQLGAIDIQRNLSDAENVVKESILETIRKQLPVRQILKEYLGGDYVDEDVGEDDVTDVMSSHTKDNLRKIVKMEIEQTLHKQLEKQVAIPVEMEDTHSRIELSDDEEEELSSSSKSAFQHSTGKSNDLLNVKEEYSTQSDTYNPVHENFYQEGGQKVGESEEPEEPEQYKEHGVKQVAHRVDTPIPVLSQSSSQQITLDNIEKTNHKVSEASNDHIVVEDITDHADDNEDDTDSLVHNNQMVFNADHNKKLIQLDIQSKKSKSTSIDGGVVKLDNATMSKHEVVSENEDYASVQENMENRDVNEYDHKNEEDDFSFFNDAPDYP